MLYRIDLTNGKQSESIQTILHIQDNLYGEEEGVKKISGRQRKNTTGEEDLVALSNWLAMWWGLLDILGS